MEASPRQIKLPAYSGSCTFLCKGSLLGTPGEREAEKLEGWPMERLQGSGWGQQRRQSGGEDTTNRNLAVPW